MDRSIENFQAAIDAVREMLEHQPDSVLAHYDLGTLCIKVNDYTGALEQHRILKGLNEDLAAKLLAQVFPVLGKAQGPETSEER